jgi:PIN domain nuclease of toxin-antitoxin system
MNLLLDTCALIWLVSGDPALSENAREKIDSSNAVFVSAATVWEIGIKVSRGKLTLPEPLEIWIASAMRQHRLVELPLDFRSAIRATELPEIHADPADRFLIGAAMIHNLALATPNRLIQKYPGLHCLW